MNAAAALCPGAYVRVHTYIKQPLLGKGLWGCHLQSKLNFHSVAVWELSWASLGCGGSEVVFFLLFFIYTLLFPYYTKALIKPLQCICFFFCICTLLAFAVSATIVFQFLTWFSSPGLDDKVLLKSPFLIILWLLSCKTQNILSDAPSIKLFQKKLSYIFKTLFDSAYCYIPDFSLPF